MYVLCMHTQQQHMNLEATTFEGKYLQSLPKERRR